MQPFSMSSFVALVIVAYFSAAISISCGDLQTVAAAAAFYSPESVGAAAVLNSAPAPDASASGIPERGCI